MKLRFALPLAAALLGCGSSAGGRQPDATPIASAGTGGAGGGGTPSGGSGGSGGSGSSGGSGGGARDAGLVAPEAGTDTGPVAADARAETGPVAAAAPLMLYTQDGPRIQVLAVDRATGEMTKKAAVDACMGAAHLLFDRAGKRLFGACPGDKGLVVLNVDRATGGLTRAGLATGGTAVGLGVHPSGDWVLTADYDGGATLYRIGADGKPETAQRVSAAVNTHGARFDGLGKYAYVTNAGSNSVNQFAFQGGKLTPLDPATVDVVTAEPVFMGKKEPRYIVDSPDGRFIYVIGQRPPSVFQFKVGSNGGLAKNGLGVSALDVPLTMDVNGKDLILSPSGDYLYASVYSTNKISVFSVDRQTGAVTLVRSVDSGGVGVGQIALDPAGQFLFAAHQSSKEVVAFRVDARTGLLTVLPGKIKVADTQAVAALTLAK